jgi:hypothetical protein
LFVTSAVESFDDRILEIFDKRHTREEFQRVVELFREAGLTLNPTFVSFTPWTSLAGYQDFLNTIRALDLIENVASIQYAIRLLIPAGSKLLDLAEVRQLLGPFDEAALCYRWTHPDPRVDRLYEAILAAVKHSTREKRGRRRVFREVWDLAHASDTDSGQRLWTSPPNDIPGRATSKRAMVLLSGTE